MFGSLAYGTAPFGGSGAAAAVAFDHAAMLADERAELVYTVEFEIWHKATDTSEVLRLATSEWATEPDDVPSSTPFDGRLTTVLQYRRSVVDSARLGINHTSNEGTIAFANSDGAYDSYVDDYAVDGRDVRVRVGRKIDPLWRHLIIFRGVAVDWRADDEIVTLTVKDCSARLDVPVQTNVYAGTSGAEGGTDIRGNRKPLSIGSIIGVPLVWVDQTLLIYQYHDNARVPAAAMGVSFLFDQGAELLSDGARVSNYAALAALPSVTAGRYRDSDDGYIRLGALASGTLLAQVACFIGPDFPGPAEIVRALAVLADVDIDATSMDKVPVPLGGVTFHVTSSDSLTIAESASSVMAGVSGWAGFDRRGHLRVGILNAPAGDPVMSFSRDEGDIIDLSREPLPDGIWPPPWRWRVAFNRVYVTNVDWAGTAPADVRQRYEQPYRLVEASDAGVKVDHPLSRDPPPIESTFKTSGTPAAPTEAARLLALYTAGYRIYRLTVVRRGLLLEIGDVVRITWPRFGFAGGKPAVVLEISDSISLVDGSPIDQVEIIVFG